jgi:serine/threonine protein kinase
MHAVVYKCFKIDDIEKLNPLAVKISRNDDQEKKIAFEKEFNITKSLSHSNIVKSYEMFTNDFSGETH